MALGAYCEVGARTILLDVAMGDYSYVVNDAQITYTTIGKFCSIAAIKPQHGVDTHTSCDRRDAASRAITRIPLSSTPSWQGSRTPPAPPTSSARRQIFIPRPDLKPGKNF